VQFIEHTCPRCNHRTAVVPCQIEHRRHLVVTILSLGLWGFSWLALVLSRMIWPLECTHCGARFTEEAARDATKKAERAHMKRADVEEEKLDAEIREILHRPGSV
jgi:transcription elongation factor Elf1